MNPSKDSLFDVEVRVAGFDARMDLSRTKATMAIELIQDFVNAHGVTYDIKKHKGLPFEFGTTKVDALSASGESCQIIIHIEQNHQL